MMGVYRRCIHVSCRKTSSSSSTASGRSPGLSRYAPSTGTAVSATSRDATSAKLTVSANGAKNAPTSPWMNASGANTTMVVIVEAKIAGPTSAVASSAALHRSRPAWMWRYTFSSTTIASSTTRPTEIARPPNVMKFSDRSCHASSSTPVNTLSGIDMAITTVGRSVLNSPFRIVGLNDTMNANTTVTANRNPYIASRKSVSICPWMLGPWSETMTMSTSGGSPCSPSSASLTASVTSIVLASASLMMETPTLGFPFVREMLAGAAAPILTSATSPSSTGPESDTPTTRPSRSSIDSSVCVVLASTACPPSMMAPAGRLTLLSLRAVAISNSETPSASILAGSAAIWTRRSTSPVTWVWRTPSMSESAGSMRDWTIP